MSLTRLLIGIIVVILVGLFISEWRKWRLRMKKERELGSIKEESHVLELNQEIEVAKKDRDQKREDLDDLRQ